MDILILAGGLSPEREVSLRSGRRLAEGLRSAIPEADVQVADLDHATLDALGTHPPDCVIPLVHGAIGEDGSLRSLLEMLSIAFVGTDSVHARIAFDKAVSASLLPTEHIPRFTALPQAFFMQMGPAQVIDVIVADLGLPVIVKPQYGGSALGVSRCTSVSDLSSALITAFGYGDDVLIQQAVSGTEIAITVIDQGEKPTALPPVEIVPIGGVYNFDARYTAGATEFFVPARLSPQISHLAMNLAVSVHQQLGLRDISRTDFIIDESDNIWFLETNVAPGLTETSLTPQAIVAAGLDVGELFSALVHRAIARMNPSQ